MYGGDVRQPAAVVEDGRLAEDRRALEHREAEHRHARGRLAREAFDDANRDGALLEGAALSGVLLNWAPDTISLRLVSRDVDRPDAHRDASRPACSGGRR